MARGHTGKWWSGPWNPPYDPHGPAEREGQDGWAGAVRKAGRWEFSEICRPAAWGTNLEGSIDFGLMAAAGAKTWALPRTLVAAPVYLFVKQ